MATLRQLRRWARGQNVSGFPQRRLRRIKQRLGNPEPIRRHQFKICVDGEDAMLFFGTWKGTTVSKLAENVTGRNYLRWMTREDFDEDLKSICQFQLRKNRKSRVKKT